MLIRTERVTKIYNRGRPNEVSAVRDVSVEIRQGEITVLRGPSGSGKTSLLGLIGCMSRPTSGRIVVKGRDVARLPERFLTEIRRSTYGFIFQQFNLVQGVSVAENIMLPLYPTALRYSEIKRRAERIMDRLRILNRRGFKIQELSGGEQQRVAIARALINAPEIILADEPTAHLDTRLSEELMDIIGELRSEGKTVVIATHDPLIYERDFVDRVIEMRDGRVTGIEDRESGGAR